MTAPMNITSQCDRKTCVMTVFSAFSDLRQSVELLLRAKSMFERVEAMQRVKEVVYLLVSVPLSNSNNAQSERKKKL